MMNLDFGYEVVEINVEQQQMAVKYTSEVEGREPITVATPFPPEGVELVEFLRRYAPINRWIEKETKRYVPEVGASGNFNEEEYLAKEEARRQAIRDAAMQEALALAPKQ